jgi:hypothetical protein
MRWNRSLSYGQGIGAAILALIVLGVWMLFFELNSEIGAGRLLVNGQLSDAQSEATKVKLDLIQLLMNWALAIIGATAFFLKLHIEKGLALRQVDLFLSLSIILAAVLSLYFGHLAFDLTATLLALMQFPLANAGLKQLGRYQYLAFFAAVLLFGIHIFQFFWRRVLTPESASTEVES